MQGVSGRGGGLEEVERPCPILEALRGGPLSLALLALANALRHAVVLHPHASAPRRRPAQRGVGSEAVVGKRSPNVAGVGPAGQEGVGLDDGVAGVEEPARTGGEGGGVSESGRGEGREGTKGGRTKAGTAGASSR